MLELYQQAAAKGENPANLARATDEARAQRIDQDLDRALSAGDFDKAKGLLEKCGDDPAYYCGKAREKAEEVQKGYAKVQLEKEGIELPTCLFEYDPNLVVSEGCKAWGPTWTAGSQPDNVQMLRDQGVITIFWTINQSDFMKDFLEQAKPNGIITGRASTLFYLYQTMGTVPPAPGMTE